jgi:NTE family protein
VNEPGDNPQPAALPEPEPPAQMPAAPVVWLASDRHRPPEDGLGLALSGGGTRAMMFHAGALLRLYEMGLFPDLRRISGVSGGSIAAGVLARAWSDLPAPGAGIDRSAAFMSAVVEPLREFARQRTDVFAWLRGTFTPGSSPVQRLADVLDKHLYHGTMLADLPDDPPRFVCNSTNLATGVLWRFSKPYMADYRLGRVMEPDVRLAVAVAASSAFPPFFSPLKLRVDPALYKEDDTSDGEGSNPADQLSRFRELPHLADGGVYDNLALETVWKRYRDVLVSDGGGGYSDDARPPTDLIVQTVRVMKTIDRQVRALRRSLLIRSYQEPPGPGPGGRRGAYWGVRTDIADYRVAAALPCPAARTAQLASEPTRLWRMKELTQQRLVNWGYAVADAAVRAHYRKADPPTGFPYPKAKV